MSEPHAPKGDVFENARPRLWGLAYRMLGSAADADDAVQDTWLRWQAAEHADIKSPDAWLTTTCSRLCIDMLKAAHRARVDYVGPWLPEPLPNDAAPGPDAPAELASSLSLAFLLLLERLTPVERAAYLLRDVFDYGYDDIGPILNRKPDACRQLVSRARKRLKDKERGLRVDQHDHGRLLDAFLSALQSGETGPLASLLAEDAELWTDGGGKVLAQTEVIHGREDAARVLAMIWETAWRKLDFATETVNGHAALILRENGRIVGVLSLSATSDDRISGIYVVRNPEKLARTKTSV